jgi:hypothetical protein
MRPPQRRAKRQENRSAEVYGARLTPASGSGAIKGDAYTDDELFEFKCTERQSFGVKLSAWREHLRNALVAHKRAVMEIQFVSPSNGIPLGHLVVLERDDYLNMRATIEGLRFELEQYR